jgi:hypothetical protein
LLSSQATTHDAGETIAGGRESRTMDTRAQRVDRVMGYLGLLLIGVLGWTAGRLGVASAAPREATHLPPVTASRRAHV